MLNPITLISKIFKSSNQKELDKLAKILNKINKFEDSFSKLEDSEFSKKTLALKEVLQNGKSIDDMKLSRASTNSSWPEGSTLTFMQTHAGDCAFKLTLAKKARAIINNFFI